MDTTKNKQSRITTSAAERRKKFEQWISVEQLRHEGSLGYFFKTDTNEPTKVTNVMTNIDRKGLGLPLDEDLEQLPCDVCTKLAFLHLIFKDGVSTYKCQECLDAQNKNKTA